VARLPPLPHANAEEITAETTAKSSVVSQWRQDLERVPAVNKTPKNGMNKPSAGLVASLLAAATIPVVFTMRVALPAPFTGMLSDDGVTVQEGEDAIAGATEQLRLIVSVNPF